MIRLTCFSILFLACGALQSQITMFPGDANNDGVANHFDLLPVSVAYGSEGIPRPGASPIWQPQFLPLSWPQNLPVSGINLGFVDSDGNGLIDSLDMDAIALNFDSVQTASQPPPQPYLLPDTCFSCPKPDLLITFDKDTAMVKDTFYALLTLRYPPNVPPFQGSLGIAFDLTYDPENVKDDLIQVFPDTIPGDLLFVTATSNLAKSWRVSDGMIGFGAAGKGQNALFAPRLLGTVQIVVEDMVIRSVSVPFWLDASNILIINELEQIVCPGVIEVDTLVLFDPVDYATETDQWVGEVDISPNPATNTLSVLSHHAQVLQLEVFSLAGLSVLQVKNAPAFSATLDISALPPGLFFLKIKTSAGPVVRKFHVK